MKVIKVEGMHCDACVDRITKAMTEEGLKFEVSLPNKTVTIDETDEEQIRTALETLDEIGRASCRERV